MRKVCLTSGFSSRNSRRPSRDVRVCVAGTYSTALITSYLPSFAPLPQNIQSVFLLTVSSGVVKTFRIYKLVSPLTAKKPSHPGSGTGTFWLRCQSYAAIPLARAVAKWSITGRKNVWLTTLIPEENPCEQWGEQLSQSVCNFDLRTTPSCAYRNTSRYVPPLAPLCHPLFRYVIDPLRQTNPTSNFCAKLYAFLCWWKRRITRRRTAKRAVGRKR